MPTRRALLASAALAPLLAGNLRSAHAQVETSENAPAGTLVATPEAGAMPNLTGFTPLPLTGERLATFEAYVATTLAEAGVPGAAVAAVQDGAVTGYVFVDPPLGGFPPPMTITLEEGADTQPRIVLTAPADPGEADLVYPFAPVATSGTPTPLRTSSAPAVPRTGFKTRRTAQADRMSRPGPCFSRYSSLNATAVSPGPMRKERPLRPAAFSPGGCQEKVSWS